MVKTAGKEQTKHETEFSSSVKIKLHLLEQYRKLLGKSQREFAQKFNVQRETYNRWVNHQLKPSEEKVKEIENYLNHPDRRMGRTIPDFRDSNDPMMWWKPILKVPLITYEKIMGSGNLNEALEVAEKALKEYAKEIED